MCRSTVYKVCFRVTDDYKSKKIMHICNIFVAFLRKNRCFLNFWLMILGFFLKYIEVMVAPDGIEPPTQGFSILCSTN